MRNKRADKDEKERASIHLVRLDDKVSCSLLPSSPTPFLPHSPSPSFPHSLVAVPSLPASLAPSFPPSLPPSLPASSLKLGMGYAVCHTCILQTHLNKTLQTQVDALQRAQDEILEILRRNIGGLFTSESSM